jgi:hypothetical protein
MGAPCRATTGRPPGATGIRAEAARHARDSVLALADVVRDPAAPAADRVAAAQTILGYAVGRKAQCNTATESEHGDA